MADDARVQSDLGGNGSRLDQRRCNGRAASCDRGQPRGPRYGSGWLRKHTTEVRAGLRMPEGRLEVGPLLPLLGSDRMALVRTHAARASAQAKERFQRLRGPRGLVALRLRSRVELDGP